jgi:hypothetical protein
MLNVNAMGHIGAHEWLTWPEMQVLATVNVSGLSFQHATGSNFFAYLTKASCNIRCCSFNVVGALESIFQTQSDLVTVQFSYPTQGLGGINNFKSKIRKKMVACWFLKLWNGNEFYRKEVVLNNKGQPPSRSL